MANVYPKRSKQMLALTVQQMMLHPTAARARNPDGGTYQSVKPLSGLSRRVMW